MKKLIIVLLSFMMVSHFAMAEEKRKMRAQDRLIIGPIADFWSGLPDGMETNLFNRGIVIDYLQEFPLGTTNFSIATGLGFTSHNLYSDHLYIRNEDNTLHNFEKYNENWEVSNNKISLNYMSLPLEIRYRTRNLPKTLRVHAGAKVGYKVSGHSKLVGKLGDDRKTRLKEGRLDNIEDFLIGAYARAGYGRYNVFVYAPLTNIFFENNATDASFVSAGFVFVLF